MFFETYESDFFLQSKLIFLFFFRGVVHQNAVLFGSNSQYQQAFQ